MQCLFGIKVFDIFKTKISIKNLNKKYKVWLDYRPNCVRLSYDSKTNFNLKKTIEMINKFNDLSKKIEKEIQLLKKDIIQNPKKYSKVEKIW